MPRKDTSPPEPWMLPHHILLTADVRRLAGQISRDTLLAWRERRGFPSPVRSIRVGKGARAQHVDIYDRRHVMAWLKNNPPYSREIRPEP